MTTVHCPEVREHQQRYLQAGRASIQALRLLLSDPKIPVSEIVLSAESQKARTPAKIADALERDILAHFKDLDLALQARPSEDPNEKLKSSSLRFSKAIQRVQEAIGELRKMPDDALPAMIDGSLKRLKGDFLSIERQFAKDFDLTFYGTHQIIGMAHEIDLDILKFHKLVPESLTLEQVRARAGVFRDLLKLAHDHFQEELTFPKR